MTGLKLCTRLLSKFPRPWFVTLQCVFCTIQMDIATTLLEYGAETNCESKAGFTPLHLAAQEGHSDMATLLIEHKADVNQKAKVRAFCRM